MKTIIDGTTPGSTVPTGFAAGKLEFEGDLPKNDGIILILWKPGAKDPSFSWDNMTGLKFGQAMSMMIHWNLAHFGRRLARVLRSAVDYYEAALYDPELFQEEQNAAAKPEAVQSQPSPEIVTPGRGPGDEVRPK